MAEDYTFSDDRLNRLPLRKRVDLTRIIEILFEEFQKKQTPRAGAAKREARILKLILFGSHARGDWVFDKKGRYFSDYDILIIVNREAAAVPKFWRDAERRLIDEEITHKRISAPVQLIVHSLNDVNNQLAVGRPFFLDIVRDGVPLYEVKGKPFAKPGNLTAEQKREEGQKYFDEWYALSLQRMKGAKFHFNEANGKMGAAMRDAAFDAHQAAERIYHCLLLTLTLYSPKEHNIEKLRALAGAIKPELDTVWPQSRRFYKRCFELLRRAYVEARYSPHYEITAEELEWLFAQIEELQARVKTICEAHLRG